MKAQPVIIVGRNRANDMFFIVNDQTTEDHPWYQGSKDEAKVRDIVSPKVFPSKLQAKRIVSLLTKECYTTDWWTEGY